MDEKGKRKANKALSKISPGGSTNLWAGIELGLDQLRLRKKLGALMILTDGRPNVEPEGGIINQLKMYLDRNYYVSENTLISTFGFGYSLDSALLREIAEIGQGSYSFIPESGLVGSVLVNHVANIRCIGIWGAKIQAGNQEINVGNVLYGQDRDVVLHRRNAYLPITIEFKKTTEHLARKFKLTRKVDMGQTPTNEQSLEVLVQLQRMKLISAIEDGMKTVIKAGNCSEAQEIVKKAIKEVSESEVSEDPRVLGYLEDLTTQITYAFSREDWYKRWGIHYLPSLSYAHRMQQCNNFKDAGVQLYGGKMFKHYQSLAEDAFLNLPAIERRVSLPPIIGNTNHHTVPQQMNAYYNQAGGCFSGGSTVLMADGTKKRVDHVRKGDVVQTPFGHSEILCVVINQFDPSAIKNVKCKRLNGGLVITPYHPIRVDGKWQFPCSLDIQSCQKLQPVDVNYHNKMYDFVLNTAHIMIINGVECVTLGHGIQEDVVRHQYFGSNAVVKDLMRMSGWKEGAVIINWNQVARSSSNLEVVSITALS